MSLPSQNADVGPRCLNVGQGTINLIVELHLQWRRFSMLHCSILVKTQKGLTLGVIVRSPIASMVLVFFLFWRESK